MQTDEMVAVILDRNSQEKSALLKRLDQRSESTFSVNQLALESGMNYRKLDRLAAEIDQDFRTLGWSPFLVKKGLVLWATNTPKYSDYQRFLIRHSPGWQLLLHILLTPGMSLTDFCRQIYSSRSTVLRKTKALVAFFRQIGVTLSPTKMTIEGPNEEVIQILLFTFAWYGSFGSELVAAVADIETEEALVAALYQESAPALSDQVGITSLLVARLRLESGYSLPESRFPKVLFPEKLTLLQEYFRELCPDAYGWAERSAASLYYKLLVVPFLSRYDFRLPATAKNFSENLVAGDLAARLAEDLLAELAPRLFPQGITEQQRLIAACNLQAVFRSLTDPQLLRPIQLQSALPESVRDLGLLEKVVEACRQFISMEKERTGDRRLGTKHAREVLPVTLAETLYPLLSAQRYRHCLRVGIQRMPNHNMLTNLLYFLDQIAFVEYEIIQGGQDYDFYIGLTVEGLPVDRRKYLLSFLGQVQQGELFQALLDALQQKSLGSAGTDQS